MNTKTEPIRETTIMKGGTYLKQSSDQKDGKNQKRKLQEQNRQAIKDKPRRWKHISVQ